MIKSLVVSALMAVAFSVPALAMDEMAPCTKAEVKKINEMIHASTDEKMMKMAMHNVEMAKKMAAHGNIHDCRMDLTKAMKEVTPK
jgi:hypothetical protein